MKKLLYLTILLLCFSTGCEEEVQGCIDNTATNYNASATEDDGSCLYTIIKTWQISNMFVDGQDVSSPGDYITFYGDGSYLSDVDTGGIEIGVYTFSGNTLSMTSITVDGAPYSYSYTFTTTLFNGSNLTVAGDIKGNYIEIVMTS